MLTEDGEPLLSMQEQQLIDEIYGDTLGHTADEYRDLRTGTSHYQNKSYAESYQLGVHEAVQDHLLWLLDGDHDPSVDREIILQIVDEHGDDVPLVDRGGRTDHVYATAATHDAPFVEEQDVRLDQFKLQDLKGVPQEQVKPMVDAIAKEIAGLCQNGVFQFVHQVPSDKKPISSRIVLKVKYRANGEYDRHKGRLVAKGFQAVPGVDFFSTFSPMGTLTTVRMLIAIAVAMNLDLLHVDIPQAFVQSKIDAPVYLQLPNGVTVDKRHTDGRYDSRVVKLLRALYGLKQSPQLWNKELNRVLVEELGLSRASADACLYYYRNPQNGKFVLLVAEVDDLVITGTDDDKIMEIKQDFTTRYKITAWESINSFLGINMNYDRNAGVFTMDCKGKIDELFKKYPILNDCQQRTVPITEPKSDMPWPEGAPINAVDQFLVERYASIVGALIYMAITVRVDIALAVGKLSRGMHNPTRSHVFMLRSTVGYLKVHRRVKLTYRRQKTRIQELFNRIAATDSALQSISGYDYQGVKDPIVGMTDSDFASGSEKDRRSISGMAFFLFGNLISWRSKLQPFTAKSTHAAELIALSFAADEGVWLRRLLLEIGFVVPHVCRVVPADEANEGEYKQLQSTGVHLTPPILCDNKGTVFTTNNPSIHINNKALETRWYNIRDYVRDGLLKVFHIGTNDNAADFFTKPLTGEKFMSFRDFLMGDYIRRDEVALMLFARIPSIRPGPNPSAQRR